LTAVTGPGMLVDDGPIRWDDPDDLGRDELLEEHDAELGEHDRELSRFGKAISKLTGRADSTDASLQDHEARISGLEGGLSFLIGDAAARATRERDHALDYTERVLSGEAKGRGPYTCGVCGEIGHNARQHK
jgi:hypothetical protein